MKLMELVANLGHSTLMGIARSAIGSSVGVALVSLLPFLGASSMELMESLSFAQIVALRPSTLMKVPINAINVPRSLMTVMNVSSMEASATPASMDSWLRQLRQLDSFGVFPAAI